MRNLLSADLDDVQARTSRLWEELRGERLFITGGTGFVGCWLLESFVWACDRLDLGASAVVLTRDPEAFHHKAPHLASHPAIVLHRGDVRAFPLPGFIEARARIPRRYTRGSSRWWDRTRTGSVSRLRSGRVLPLLLRTQCAFWKGRRSPLGRCLAATWCACPHTLKRPTA